MTAPADNCRYPGCTGSYGPEGYCDECGRKQGTAIAPPPVTKAPAVAEPSISGPSTSGSSISEPSISGPSTSGPSTSGATMPTTTAGTGPSTGAPTTTTGSGRSTRGSRRGSGRSHGITRGGLGAGLVEMTPVELRDPTSAVMSDPQVPENKRFCAACDRPVGRSKDDRPGRTEGFCPNCGRQYAFRPGLSRGELVAGRYEILGCLAHGGLGWIYLARDRNLAESGDRWVVLKGLIDTGDPDAVAAAMAERRFLVEVDHPSIVKIHDIVQRLDPRTGRSDGYIVMEYIGGRSLKDIALSRLGPTGLREPIPLPEVLAYGLEILPALGYLHARGLLFCDFKPDNVIQTEEQLKLIDLGAVRRLDDDVSPLYGTPGYQAPELAKDGPSIESDLYTLGRTLAVLSFDFRGFSKRYATRLPDVADVELFRREESYHRLLRRATHPDAARRFGSAAEMREQLLGVLHEVLSAADRQPRPLASPNFGPERRVFGSAAGALDPADVTAGTLSSPAVSAALPLPQVDVTDPGAGFLATVTATDPAEALAALETAPVKSPEVRLRRVRAWADAGDFHRAEQELHALAGDDPTDWRLDWYRGLVALAADRPADARRSFDTVYDALPGEIAAKLAVAAAAELAGDRKEAVARYHRVWMADRGYVSVAFALARCHLGENDRNAAVAVLDEVPDQSAHHVAAQVAAVRARLSLEPGTPGQDDLMDAAARAHRLKLDRQRRAMLSIEVLERALTWVLGQPDHWRETRGTTGLTLLGRPLRERDLRFGLEAAYRLLASMEHEPLARYKLVDTANAVRPRTVV